MFDHFEIVETKWEAPKIRTLKFEAPFAKNTKPGQFLTLFIPQEDANPFSLSYIEKDRNVLGITFKIIEGGSTEYYSELEEGDLIPIGIPPRGNGFSLKGKKVLVISGGMGIAPTPPLVEELYSLGRSVTTIIGAKTKDEIFFEGRLRSKSSELIVTTDDGSYGKEGLVTDVLQEMSPNFDRIYSVGPELMMKEVLKYCIENDVIGEFGLERYMKCCVGLCGSCLINGYRVCTDGPVFTSEQLKGIEDFGESKYDIDAKKIRIEHPFSEH